MRTSERKFQEDFMLKFALSCSQSAKQAQHGTLLNQNRFPDAHFTHAVLSKIMTVITANPWTVKDAPSQLEHEAIIGHVSPVTPEMFGFRDLASDYYQVRLESLFV